MLIKLITAMESTEALEDKLLFSFNNLPESSDEFF